MQGTCPGLPGTFHGDSVHVKYRPALRSARPEALRLTRAGDRARRAAAARAGERILVARVGAEAGRAWVQRGFGPALRPGDAGRVHALVAATDLDVWTLLRLDLGRPPEAVTAAVRRVVRGVLEVPCTPC